MITPLLFLTSSNTSALSCMQPDPANILSAEENINAHDYVFIGAITEANKADYNTNDYHSHTIQVAEWINGNDQRTVELLSDATWGAFYEQGTKAIFMFNDNETANPEYNSAYDAAKLQFVTDLCGDGNPQIVSSEQATEKAYTDKLDGLLVNIPPEDTTINGQEYSVEVLSAAFEEFINYEEENNINYPETKDLRQTSWGYEGSSTKLDKFYLWFIENKTKENNLGTNQTETDNKNEEDDSFQDILLNLMLGFLPVVLIISLIAMVIRHHRNLS